MLSAKYDEVKNKLYETISRSTTPGVEKDPYRHHNKIFADAHAEIVGIQLYEIVTSLNNQDMSYSYNVLENNSYRKLYSPLTSPSDTVQIPERLIRTLKDCMVSGRLGEYIRQQVDTVNRLCKNKSAYNENLILANLMTLRVAITIHSQNAGYSPQDLEPAFEFQEIVTEISSKRRTGVIEAVILNEVLGNITSYFFNKKDGAPPKQGRWYSAIRKTKSNRLFLITFDSHTTYEKVQKLTDDYMSSLLDNHLL